MARARKGGARHIHGPEPWKSVGGVELCHWDLWFIVVADDFDGGRDMLLRLLDPRQRGVQLTDRNGREAKLHHLADLERRMAAVGLTSVEVLAEVEITKPLLRKARRKVIESYLAGKDETVAMVNTPRNVLSLSSAATRDNFA